MLHPTLIEIAQAVGKNAQELNKVAEVYPFKLSAFLSKRITEGTYSLEAAAQFIPDIRELEERIGFEFDPGNERRYKPLPNVIQKFDNRAAIILTQHCLVYCRFCFRRDFVGYPNHQVSEKQIDEALDYIEAHPNNVDVLISGGDPLALPNRRLLPILQRLASIRTLKAIRIHSRALSVAPERIDDELVSVLARYRKFWFYAHMNHPDDLEHDAVIAAAEKLRQSGTPILNQTVLLGGINDNPLILKRLLMACYENRIIPFDLYIPDKVKGTTHFQVPLRQILEIYEMIGKLPGPAQPTLALVDHNDEKQRFGYNTLTPLGDFLSRDYFDGHDVEA